MRVAQKFAGYSLAEADNLRKACGKKIRELMAQEREKFVDGVRRDRLRRELGTKLFDIIEPFADYAFPKSHTYGYGLIAYQTAYLKAHYPVEYLAALLTSVKASLDKAAVYLAECRQLGHRGARPRRERLVDRLRGARCRRGARRHRAAAGHVGLIPFGLSAVRNVGEGLVRQHRPGAREERAVHRLLRLLRAGRPDRAQQAGDRVAHQGRRVRLARPPPPGPAVGLRADHRPDAGPSPRARPGRDEPVRRGHATASTSSTSESRSPTSSSTRPSGSRSRRRCSASTSATTR